MQLTLFTATNTIVQAIRDGTPLGEQVSWIVCLLWYDIVIVKAKEKLFAGEVLDDVFVGEMIMEKLQSPEVHHYGMWRCELMSVSSTCGIIVPTTLVKLWEPN